LYVLVSDFWQVSMVRQAASAVTPDSIQTLAAPQQLPSPHPPLSPLASLKVPLERAFSHLAPMVPGLGVICDLRSFSMVSSAFFLLSRAVSRVFLYASNLRDWHATVAAVRAFSLALRSASALITSPTAVSRSPC